VKVAARSYSHNYASFRKRNELAGKEFKLFHFPEESIAHAGWLFEAVNETTYKRESNRGSKFRITKQAIGFNALAAAS
jgi:hypothetical protein